jgi:hypothetical protein
MIDDDASIDVPSGPMTSGHVVRNGSGAEKAAQLSRVRFDRQRVESNDRK